MLAVLATAAMLAPTATVGREGTELVYRAAPGQEDRVVFAGPKGTVEVFGPAARVSAGPGCDATRRGVRCSTAGITAIRILAADGNDDVSTEVDLPVVVDLGPGNDRFEGSAKALALTGGDGDDEALFSSCAGTIDVGAGNDIVDALAFDLTGPLQVVGGEGDDRLWLDGETGAGTALDGGAGDDRIVLRAEGTGADIACGPGADRVDVALEDRPGDGCAPRLTGITTRTVSRRFREGALTAPAAGSVRYRRDPRQDGGAELTIARGTFDAPAGPLRVQLELTSHGRRWTRRTPRLPVLVTVSTRAGGDHLAVGFGSRLR